MNILKLNKFIDTEAALPFTKQRQSACPLKGTIGASASLTKYPAVNSKIMPPEGGLKEHKIHI